MLQHYPREFAENLPYLQDGAGACVQGTVVSMKARVAKFKYSTVTADVMVPAVGSRAGPADVTGPQLVHVAMFKMGTYFAGMASRFTKGSQVVVLGKALRNPDGESLTCAKATGIVTAMLLIQLINRSALAAM